MAAEFTPIPAHTYSELADALAALKAFRGLSNEALDELTGLTRGAVDKMLGPARVKGIGKNSLPWLLAALGGRLVLERDPEQEKLMASRWEKRNHSQVRIPRPQPISKELLERAKQIIFAKHTRKATLASIVARKGWRTRRQAQRRNGNGPAAAK
jgi:hypothetical protein